MCHQWTHSELEDNPALAVEEPVRSLVPDHIPEVGAVVAVVVGTEIVVEKIPDLPAAFAVQPVVELAVGAERSPVVGRQPVVGRSPVTERLFVVELAVAVEQPHQHNCQSTDCHPTSEVLFDRLKDRDTTQQLDLPLRNTPFTACSHTASILSAAFQISLKPFHFSGNKFSL